MTRVTWTYKFGVSAERWHLKTVSGMVFHEGHGQSWGPTPLRGQENKQELAKETW